MLTKTVRVGDTLRFSDRNHGNIGTMRVENKSGGSVRLVFDVPETFLIRPLLDHQEHKTSFGLTGEARGPLQHATI